MDIQQVLFYNVRYCGAVERNYMRIILSNGKRSIQKEIINENFKKI
jgi:hypothetical protein